MNKKISIYILLILIIPVALLGCSSKAPASPTTNPNLIYTAAAQTADARLTQIFQSTPSATPVTPSPTVDFVRTMAAQTASALLTQSATQTPPTQAATQTTGTPPPATGGDKATFVADITIPDGTVVAAGADFTKTWRIQNAGTTTWSTGYKLEFISGEQMGPGTSVSIAQSVAPGAQIDISVSMVAPDQSGSYQSFWKMKNASGQFFNDSVYVMVTVGSGGTAQPTSTSGTGATPTATGTPPNLISNLSMAVDAAEFNGQCPHVFTFTANFTLSSGATLTYGLEAGTDTPGFQFELPGPQTSAFGPGQHSLSFPMEFTDSGAGWVSFHITSPVDMDSNQATFSLTCTP